jgi:Ni/Co efflux regulator RcnB
MAWELRRYRDTSFPHPSSTPNTTSFEMEVVMKKFIIGALTAAMLASPIAIAPALAQGRHDRGHAGRAQPAPQYRHWNKGQRFDRRYAQNYQEIGNWQQYRGRRLYAPPRGYHWVRSGNDAVLVAVAGGLIGAVLSGAFN